MFQMTRTEDSATKTKDLFLLIMSSSIPFLLSYVSVRSSSPGFFSPYPFASFYLYSLNFQFWAIAVIFLIVFYLLNLNLFFRKRYKFHFWIVTFLMTTGNIGMVPYLLFNLENGISRYGFIQIFFIIILNIFVIASFWVFWYTNRKRPEFLNGAVLSHMFFFWTFWCGYPYFGEGI